MDCRLAGAKEAEEVDEAGEAEVDSSAAVVVPWEHLSAVEGRGDLRLRDLCPRRLRHLSGGLPVLQTKERP